MEFEFYKDIDSTMKHCAGKYDTDSTILYFCSKSPTGGVLMDNIKVGLDSVTKEVKESERGRLSNIDKGKSFLGFVKKQKI